MKAGIEVSARIGIGVNKAEAEAEAGGGVEGRRRWGGHGGISVLDIAQLVLTGEGVACNVAVRLALRHVTACYS